MPGTISKSRRRIAYFYEPEVGYFYLSPHHPMKPYRILMTHELVLNYGINNYLTMYKPHHATRMQLERFHDKDYLDLIYTETELIDQQGSSSGSGSGTSGHISKGAKKGGSQFKFTPDCPSFFGMSKYIEMFCGASIEAGLFFLNISLLHFHTMKSTTFLFFLFMINSSND